MRCKRAGLVLTALLFWLLLILFLYLSKIEYPAIQRSRIGQFFYIKFFHLHKSIHHSCCPFPVLHKLF